MEVEDYIDVARRHKGWMIGPTFAGLVIAVVVAFLWPDTYISDAMMRILPPMVPERLVPTNVNLQLGQRLAAMDQSVRSRNNLLDLINSNGLYPRKKGKIPDEDLVEQMRRDLQVDAVLPERSQAQGVSTAFRISFAYENRYVAQKVVSAVVTKFMDLTQQTRSDESVETSQFLKEKLDAAKKNLDDIENRISDYRVKFAGKLPEQLDSNLQQMRTLETQLATANSSINRATQDKLLLENQLRIVQEQLDTVSASGGSSLNTALKNERLMQLERQISDAEASLAGLRQQYKDTHPDIRRAEAQLSTLKSTRDALLKDEQKKQDDVATKKKEPEPPSREQMQAGGDIERLQALIRTKDAETQDLVKEQARIDKLIKVYQTRVDASPIGQREYAQLTRDYGMAKSQYEDLMLKSNSSAMATDLETRKQGEVLELLEQASLPQTAAQPNRWYIVGIGTLLGLAAGVGLAGVMEMKDTSLKNLKDVRAYTGLPVLGSVPLVENDFVVQRKRRLAWLAWSTACIFGFLVMLGSVYYYFTRA
jgi:polysaccharide chain length determinant protein (PEP-CTERM system associated)